MEEEENQFKNKLNAMKAVQFRELKELKIVNAAFQAIKNLKCQLHPHYQMSLYCKTIKGLMLNRIRLNALEQRLENVYVGILFKTHFEAMKQFKFAAEQQRNEQTQQLQRIIKKQEFAIFIKTVKKVKAKRKLAATLKNESSRVEEFKYKTETQFFPRKQQDITFPSKFAPRPLDDSRRSAISSLSISSQLQAKRKFIAVKELPKMLQLQSVIEQEKQTNPSEVVDKKQTNKEENKKIEEFKSANEESVNYNYSAFNKKEEINSKKEEINCKIQEKPRQKENNCNKEEIISMICKLKMLEISTLEDIIQDYSTSLKQQSLITEKNYLSLSLSTLKSVLEL